MTREELFSQAEARGLPRTKGRGIVREYAHYLILHSINAHTDKMIFTGGTALRLLHNFGRLSFDLDFDAHRLNRDEFADTLGRVTSDLAKSGVDARLLNLRQRRSILTSEIRMPTIFGFYEIGTAHEQLMVKVEVLDVPKRRLKIHPNLARNFDGHTILVNALEISYLAAEKCAAFFERARERDYYDILFLLVNRKPIDLELLNTIRPTHRFANAEDLYAQVRNKFERTDMAAVARKLEPFLIDPAHGMILSNAVAHLP